MDRSYTRRFHTAQVCSELRPWTKALEKQLDILVLSDLLYSSSEERKRKYHDFLESVGDRKAKLKLYSAWREALQDVVSTVTVAKVMVSLCLSHSELFFSPMVFCCSQ